MIPLIWGLLEPCLGRQKGMKMYIFLNFRPFPLEFCREWYPPHGICRSRQKGFRGRGLVLDCFSGGHALPMHRIDYLLIWWRVPPTILHKKMKSPWELPPGVWPWGTKRAASPQSCRAPREMSTTPTGDDGRRTGDGRETHGRRSPK